VQQLPEYNSVQALYRSTTLTKLRPIVLHMFHIAEQRTRFLILALNPSL
jgi:hypothetical protein